MIKSTKRCLRGGATVLTSVALAIASAGIASAAEASPFGNGVLTAEGQSSAVHAGLLQTTESSPMSASEEEQLAEELEVLFTRYVQMNQSDVFEVNEANVVAEGHEKDLSDLQRLAEGLNALAQEKPSSTPWQHSAPVVRPLGAGEFALCVLLEGLGIPAAGASPGLIAAIKEGIRAWNWGLTARTVARILGPSVVKALGGPVGIGVALGWAAWSCRGKL